MADVGLRVTGLLLVLSGLLPAPAAAIECLRNQYGETRGGRDVCCNYCAAGQQIADICTPSNKASECINCKKNRYNPENGRDGCKLCTVCNKAEGSIEKKPCTSSSDAECECPEGSTPRNDRKTACRCDKGKEIVNNKCQPCKSGYFSTEENSVCRPWSNCSTMGRTVLEEGSAIKDVKCTKPSPVTVRTPTIAFTPTSSNHRRKVTTNLQNVTTTNRIFINDKTTPSNSLDSGTLSLIVIGAVLLLVSAGIILTMIMQINRKKLNRGFIRGERCRVPVQEESTSSDSSLPKDCPA